jgi:hypothetical protein
VLLAAAAAHLAFSWIGFNPTDEGFILSASRRLLDGQVPHRDFISIRPALPYFTFLPVVWLGGDYTIWLSRGVAWIELALTAWCWVILLDQMLGLGLGRRSLIALGVSTLALCAHTFPVMAWHSLDALVAASVGLALALDARPRIRWIGYAALGVSVLARQNFGILVAGALLLSGDWRRPRHLVAAALPVGLSALVLWALRAGPAALDQLASKHDLVPVGLLRYLRHDYLPWTLPLGAAAMALLAGDVRLARGRGDAEAGPVLGALALTGAAFWAALELRFPDFAMEQSFGLFGLAAGGWLWLAAGPLLGRPGGAPPEVRRKAVRAGAVVLLAAWTVSLSFGYSTPALLAGALVALLLGWPLALLGKDAPSRHLRAVIVLVLVAHAAISAVTLGLARWRWPYRDQPASRLSIPLDGLLAGGRWIRTNPFTAAYLADLGEAVRRAGPGPVAIVPDDPAYWVKSAQPNPLPIDWAEGFTLSPPALFDRVTAAMRAGTPRPVVIVAKACAECLPDGLFPVPADSFHKMAPWVRAHGRKLGETRLFELYRVR